MTDLTTTYILTHEDGSTSKMTIPATWRLTFGNIIPYSVTKQGAPVVAPHRVALRVYAGSKDNLRAVITGVSSFRDEKITILTAKDEEVMKALFLANGGGKEEECGANDIAF